ncbi:hypothetical protein [Aeromicrobium stalagmiti]|uniref:hypothetical protein n=1 Tax=Aeromicrobium stalagmiti TaxID=2738988 RepID=UPI0020C2F73C|nr:hypothetical protein [Aeromicrobium stalagmiti]
MSFRTAHLETLRQRLWPVLSGALTSLGFAPASVPVATLAGMTMLIALLRAQAREGGRLRASMAAGLLYGLGLAVPLLWWMRVVSPGALMALAVAQAALIAVSIAAVRLVIALPGWPIWATGVWMTTEYLLQRRDRVDLKRSNLALHEAEIGAVRRIRTVRQSLRGLVPRFGRDIPRDEQRQLHRHRPTRAAVADLLIACH